MSGDALMCASFIPHLTCFVVMGDSSNAPEAMFESIVQLQTLVKKVESMMTSVQKAFNALEKRVARLEAQNGKNAPIEEEEELSAHVQDGDKRMTFLKAGTSAVEVLVCLRSEFWSFEACMTDVWCVVAWGQYIDQHLKEGHGLFMDGNASKEAMYAMFGAAPSQDAEMTYNEQRTIAMWVR